VTDRERKDRERSATLIAAALALPGILPANASAQAAPDEGVVALRYYDYRDWQPGASRMTVFRRIIFPNLTPAILAGAGLAFARAVGEFGSLVLLAGNVPFKTQAASVFIFSMVESNNPVVASAVSVVLLAIALGVLLIFAFLSKKALRHDE